VLDGGAFACIKRKTGSLKAEGGRREAASERREARGGEAHKWKEGLGQKKDSLLVGHIPIIALRTTRGLWECGLIEMFVLIGFGNVEKDYFERRECVSFSTGQLYSFM